MSAKWFIVMCLQLSLTSSAAMMQLLPLQLGMQSQLQFLRKLAPANLNSPIVMYPQQPMMILLPQTQNHRKADDRYSNLNEHEQTDPKEDLKSNTGYEDEDSEAIVLDAEPNSANFIPKNAVILMPNRGFIGDIISYVPFLPIEINVPDTINWIIDAIGSLGNRFRPQAQALTENNLKRFSSKGPIMPILVMPLGGPMLPQML